MAVLGIKRIIAVAFHPIDELWGSDGVRYTTHIIPYEEEVGGNSHASVRDVIETAAEEVAFAMANEIAARESVLIACPSGNEYSSNIAALYLARTLRVNIKCAIEMMVGTCDSWFHEEFAVLLPLLCFCSSSVFLTPCTFPSRLLSYKSYRQLGWM